MSLLDRLLPWRSDEDRTVQYEVQRMTHRGGWKAHLPSAPIPEPVSRPTDDDDWWLSPEGGRFRHIRRVDGRIDEVLWTYETENAEEQYERERQRQQLQKMSLDEVEAEYFGETNRLDRLELGEIRERYDTLRDQ